MERGHPLSLFKSIAPAVPTTPDLTGEQGAGGAGVTTIWVLDDMGGREGRGL